MSVATPNQSTVQGQQLNDTVKLLQAITNAPPQSIPTSDLQSGYNQTLGQSIQMSQNAPQAQQQFQNQQNQQLVAPLQAKYGDINQLFNMYLHDDAMSKKYSLGGGQGSVNPYADPVLMASANLGAQNLYAQNLSDQQKAVSLTPQNVPQTQQPAINIPQYDKPTPSYIAPTAVDPYLASGSALTANAMQAPESPGETLASRSVPINATNDLFSLLNSVIGTQQNLASSNTQQEMAAYTGKLNTLQTIANLLGNQLQSQKTSGAGGYAPGSNQETSAIMLDIKDKLGGNATRDDVWNYLNTHMQELTGLYGSKTMGNLWKMQSQMPGGKVGTGKVGSEKVPQVSITGQDTKVKLPNGTSLKKKKLYFGHSVDSSELSTFYTKSKEKGATDQEIIDFLKNNGWE